MAYPQDRALPLARLGGSYVGLDSHEDLAKLIDDKFQQSKIQFKAGDKISAVYSLSLAGSEVDSEYMIHRMVDYPYWQRFIPLSILWQPVGLDNFSLSYTKTIQSKFSNERSKELSVPPKNAGIEIKEGQVISSKESTGINVSSDDVTRSLDNNQIKISNYPVTIYVEHKNLTAKKTTNDFKPIQQQASSALSKKVVLKFADKTFSPSLDQQASWLKIDSDQKGNTILVINQDNLKSYLEELNKQIGHSPGQSNVSIVNGIETGRQVGEKGAEIDYQNAIESISGYLLNSDSEGFISLKMKEVEPVIIYNNRYTATEDGLRSYVNDASRRGAWISIQQIDGSKWSAAARENESLPSASTYKLFVSLLLFDKMDRGEVNWSDSILDTNVSVCFDRMTIASTNPCAQEWLGRYGRDNMNNFLYEKGFSKGTDFTNPVATHTTASDLTKFMIGLNDGSLISGLHRDRLYRSLSTHPYRYGIPTGSAAREIYDKVGFLWDYVHDTAIVHHPRGTYIMTIMTKGQSYAAIASMTREIERIMYP